MARNDSGKAKAKTAAVAGVAPARKRGGSRSREPSPKAKRVRRGSSPVVGSTSSARDGSRRAKVIKGTKEPVQPLFFPSSNSEDDEGEDSYPDDGMDCPSGEDEEDQHVDQNLIDFMASLNDKSEDDDADDDYTLPVDGLNSEDDNDNDNDEADNFDIDSRELDRLRDDANGVISGSGKLSSSTVEHLSSGTTRKGDLVQHTSQARTPRRNRGNSPPYTPYTDRPNPKDASKPLLSSQTPSTRNIVRHAQHTYRSNVVAKNAFPDDATRNDLAAKFFINAATDLNLPRRIARFRGDDKYQDVAVKLVKKSDTGVRGEIVNAAREIVGTSYGLGPGRGSIEHNKMYVEMLASNGNFLYRVLETEEADERPVVVKSRSGPYRHVIIATLIQQEFFNGHEQMAVADLTAGIFNPIPLPVIALAATAIQCALRDWSSGIHVKSAVEFSSDEWSTVYNGHLNELTKMLNKKPREVDAWTRKLWRDCWSTTSQFLSGSTAKESFITEAEMDDFDDIIEA